MATNQREGRRAREEKLDELHGKLTRAVERQVTGENWTDALRFEALSRSFNNVVPIWEQHQAAFEQGRVPTPSFPAKPLTTSGMHNFLVDPYYQGIVTFRAVTYPGTHDPLVSQETFDQVQMILRQNPVVGGKPQKSDHYLKGSIY